MLNHESDPLYSKWSTWLFSCFLLYFISVGIRKYHTYQADLTFGRQNGCQMPPQYPNRWPFGLDGIRDIWRANAEGHLLDFFSTIAKEYEPRNTLSQFFLAGPRAFHIFHPKNLEAVLASDFKNYGFGCRPAVFAPLLGDGIFTQEGQAWRHSRELLRKQFSRVQYQKFDHFHEHVDNLISCIPSEGDIDLQPLFFKLTMDVATSMLFGHSVYSLRASLDQDAANREFDESFSIAQDGLAKRFRLAPFQFLYNPPAFRKACKNVHEFVESYIEERSRTETDSKDSSSWFIDQITSESKSRKEVRDQLINVLLAGRDTTACCLSWTVRLLVRNAAVMERLRNEIRSVMEGSTIPTREQVRRMPYLICVVKESLRLYPPVPMNTRHAIRTTVLPTGGGPDGNSPILVRKGEQIIFSPYVNSRRQSLYGKDAESFRPERWETGELTEIGWAYFPFNGGPRQCLGEDFALMEVYYTLVRLLQTLPVISLPKSEVSDQIGKERQRVTLVLSSVDGCRVTVGKAA